MYKSAIVVSGMIWSLFAMAGPTLQCDSSYLYVNAGTYQGPVFKDGTWKLEEPIKLTNIPCSAISKARYAVQVMWSTSWVTATCQQQNGWTKFTPPSGSGFNEFSSGQLEITLDSGIRVDGNVSVGFITGALHSWSNLVTNKTDSAKVEVYALNEEVTLKPGATKDSLFRILTLSSYLPATLTYSASTPSGKGVTGGFTTQSAIPIGPSVAQTNTVTYQFSAAKDAAIGKSLVTTTWTLTCE
ncbi:hypothetical protein [Tatumella sp. UCD-D_suzukii]|uniref:hypothetical protein n=1 Tax=Tatumella sp. UCD-D_suzukii TaxID=1408192 RepID=UPI00128F9111|nr:hypothetical protein [Tatumella sp. UCD-D_suzukii]